MSSGSAALDPKYTSFDPNVLAESRRSNESPAPQEQLSIDNINVNKAASSPQTNVQSKKDDSTDKRSVRLTLKYYPWGLPVLTFVVQVCGIVAESLGQYQSDHNLPKRIASTYASQNRPYSPNTENFKGENNLKPFTRRLGDQ
jgi:hypothetical protein